VLHRRAAVLRLAGELHESAGHMTGKGARRARETVASLTAKLRAEVMATVMATEMVNACRR